MSTLTAGHSSEMGLYIARWTFTVEGSGPPQVKKLSLNILM